MSASPEQTPAAGGSIQVPFERVTALARQISHDVRNGLSGIDLQAAYLAELVTEPEAAAEVKRIRGMIAQTTKALQAMTSRFSVGTPTLVTYPAALFLADFRERLAAAFPKDAPNIAWTEQLGEEAISVDLEMLFSAVSEIFKNAFVFQEKGQPVEASAGAAAGRLVIELREGKSAVPSPPETWGREPLLSTRRGGYGLGLFHARALLAVHGGDVSISHDPEAGVLITHITLPLAAA